MAYQNFYTDYIETDPNNRVTRDVGTPHKVTWGNTLDSDGDTYVHRDMGAAHFAGDFEHKFEVENAGSGGGGSGMIQGHWAVSTVIDRLYDLAIRTDQASLIFMSNLPGRWAFLSRYFNAGYTLTHTPEFVSDEHYYITPERDEEVGEHGTMYIYIRTGSHSGSLFALLTVALLGKADLQYIYPMNDWNASGGNYLTENLDLQEAPAVQLPFRRHYHGLLAGGGL